MSGEHALREPLPEEDSRGAGPGLLPPEDVAGFQAPSGVARGRRRLRLTPPAHVLESGGARGARASVVLAVGFVAALASSPGQSY